MHAHHTCQCTPYIYARINIPKQITNETHHPCGCADFTCVCIHICICAPCIYVYVQHTYIQHVNIPKKITNDIHHHCGCADFARIICIQKSSSVIIDDCKYVYVYVYICMHVCMYVLISHGSYASRSRLV